MKKNFITTLFIALTVYAKAQSDGKIVIGHTDTVYSQTLKEKRKILVYTPDLTALLPDSGKRYPVLYLLDGDAHFASTVGLIQQLSQANGNTVLPEMIVIGISHTDRLKELTPSSAGAETEQNPFVSFLEKELMPYVEKNYPAAPYNILVGHSLGGLTAIDLLTNKPGLFNAYLAIDPSMWYGNEKFLNHTLSALPGNKMKQGTRLFIAAANTMPKGMLLSDLDLDTAVETQHIRSIVKLNRFLKSATIPALTYGYRFYADESHVSVPLIGEYDGLRFLFDYYLLDIRERDFADTTTRIATIHKAHYDRISKELGYKVVPPEAFMNYLGYDALAKKQYAKAGSLLQLNMENYPNSHQAHAAYADWLLATNDKAGAMVQYKKSLAIKDDATIHSKLLSITQPFTLSAKELQQYAGEYIVEAYNFPLLLEVRNSALWSVVSGQGDDEWLPLSKDNFTLKDKQGFAITFQREGNAITGFTSVQPNGTFKITRKQ